MIGWGGGEGDNLFELLRSSETSTQTREIDNNKGEEDLKQPVQSGALYNYKDETVFTIKDLA